MGGEPAVQLGVSKLQHQNVRFHLFAFRDQPSTMWQPEIGKSVHLQPKAGARQDLSGQSGKCPRFIRGVTGYLAASGKQQFNGSIARRVYHLWLHDLPNCRN